MGKKTNLTGQKFGRLTVIGDSGERDYDGTILWDCICECGTKKRLRTQNFTQHMVKSCGCYKEESWKKRITTHGGCRTRLYKIWGDMKIRCFNPNSTGYYLYGEKGITICKEWLDFDCFREWSLNNGYQVDLTIDRIDSNGDYEPSNCRWTTVKEQNRNTSRNVYITYQGETKSLPEWCEILNIKRQTVYARKRKGFPEELWLAPTNLLKQKEYLKRRKKA